MPYVAYSADMKAVPLYPGSQNDFITKANFPRYLEQLRKFRFHEYDVQIEAIRHGLGSIIPLGALSLLSWSHLETLVCGSPVIDVALLESVTDYSGCSRKDPHVQNFWRAMREYSNDDRSAFVKFTWGRSRLPLTKADFSQRMKIQNMNIPNGTNVDAYLPSSHTCFFSIEIPRYTTFEVLKAKVLYAIYNCPSIDGDNTETGARAANLGWEE